MELLRADFEEQIETLRAEREERGTALWGKESSSRNSSDDSDAEMRLELLRHEHEQQLTSLREEHEEAIGRARAEEEKRVDAIHAEHEERIAALRAQLAEQSASVPASEVKPASATTGGADVAALREDYERRIAALRAEHEKQIAAYRADEAKRAAEFRAEAEKHVATLLAEQERRIAQLEDEAAGPEAEMVLKEAKAVRGDEVPRAYFVFVNSGKAAASDFNFRLEYVLPDQLGRIEGTVKEVVAPSRPIGIPFDLAFLADRKPDERLFLRLFVDYKDERTGARKAAPVCTRRWDSDAASWKGLIAITEAERESMEALIAKLGETKKPEAPAVAKIQPGMIPISIPGRR